MNLLTKTDLKNIIESRYNIDLSTRSRKREFVYYRYIYYQLCKELIPNSTASGIGRMVNRDHASVLHGLNQFPYIVLYDSDFLKTYNKIKTTVEVEFDRLQSIIDKSKKTYGVINVRKIHPHLLRYAQKPLRKILVERGQVAKRSNGLPKD